METNQGQGDGPDGLSQSSTVPLLCSVQTRLHQQLQLEPDSQTEGHKVSTNLLSLSQSVNVGLDHRDNH